MTSTHRTACKKSELNSTYFVETLIPVHPFRLDVVQVAAQGLPALLIEDPGVALVYLVAVHPGQVLSASELRELWLRDSSQSEEVSPEPNFLDVGLMRVLRDYLFDRELLSALDVPAQPDQAESPPA